MRMTEKALITALCGLVAKKKTCIIALCVPNSWSPAKGVICSISISVPAVSVDLRLPKRLCSMFTSKKAVIAVSGAAMVELAVQIHVHDIADKSQEERHCCTLRTPNKAELWQSELDVRESND
ncbi:hypothetical protein KXD40_005911 [Peronospora effusa]|nr:hypothetical protein KXD40_005911 [Peronospora effusa]